MEWLDPQYLMEYGGMLLVVAAVYFETGFLIGLIVPGGETLLLTAGLLVGTGAQPIAPWLLWAGILIAAVAGDYTAYGIGRSIGPVLYRRRDGWLYKKKYLQRTQDFYDRHGRMALILGRFVPVIRTFNPLLSGVTRMPLRKFSGFILPACFLYVTVFVGAGYGVGRMFPQLREYVHWIWPFLVGGTCAAVVYQLWKQNRTPSEH